MHYYILLLCYMWLYYIILSTPIVCELLTTFTTYYVNQWCKITQVYDGYWLSTDEFALQCPQCVSSNWLQFVYRPKGSVMRKNSWFLLVVPFPIPHFPDTSIMFPPELGPDGSKRGEKETEKHDMTGHHVYVWERLWASWTPPSLIMWWPWWL